MSIYKNIFRGLNSFFDKAPAVKTLGLWLIMFGISFQGLSQEQFIKEIGNRYTRKAYYNSVAIGVVNGDSSKIYTFGEIGPEMPGIPTKNSYYEIGSLTKLYTTLIFQDLAEEGKLDPHTPVKRFLPDSVNLTSKDSAPIRLHHLATHTSGLPRLDENYFYQRSQDIYRISQNPFKNYTKEDLYQFLNEVIPFAKPGEKLLFSNMGMGLLGHILEKVTDKSYKQLLSEYTDKMGLMDTKIQLKDTTRERYLLPGFNRRKREMPYWDFQVLAPVAALKSTPFDMLRFLKISMGKIKTPLTPVIQKAQNIRDSGNLKDMKNVKLGYGWFKGPRKIRGEEAYWHNGQTGGFSSFITFLPEQQQGVVVLANTNGGVAGVAYRVLKVLNKN